MDHSDKIRVVPVESDDGVFLEIGCRSRGGSWRTVLSNRADQKHRPWERETVTSLEDVEIRPGGSIGTPCFQAAHWESTTELILSGERDEHALEERISFIGPNQISIGVSDTISKSDVLLNRLMNHFYFVPDGRSMGYALPLDFAWLPGLHGKEKHVAGDWFFRSPAAIVFSHGLYAALVPQLEWLDRHPDLRHALDLRSWQHPGSGETYGLPRISYGICSWHPDGHVFTAADDATVTLEPGRYQYGFELFVGEADSPAEVVSLVARWLWSSYGRDHLQDIRPQVLPFEEYGHRYTYAYELEQWATPVEHEARTLYGFNNVWRRGANFHAWENDLHTGFGVYHYGRRNPGSRLEAIGSGMLGLALSSPSNEGAFPCVFNFETSEWEGSLYWTSWPAESNEGYDLQAMGVSAWWMLYWRDHFPDLGYCRDIVARTEAFWQFLCRVQLPSGAIPTYYDRNLRAAPQLREAAPTAIAGAVLAKYAHETGDQVLKDAAIRAGEFILREVLSTGRFFDFELFYSCAPKPLYWVDPVNGIPPANTLAIQWSADHFLALYTLTGDANWLSSGKHCLNLLSLFQQVWAPRKFGPAYMFGGFGVMNCDGEWNDGRQSRVVPTYADYYDATGDTEYLERAVAACRASFAAMDIQENHDNGINAYSVDRAEGIRVEPGRGYSPESIMHGDPHVMTGMGGGWTGFNWGPGGGLGASAMLELRYGGVWIDTEARQALGIDGALVEILRWDTDCLSLSISSALTKLARPFLEKRPVRIKFKATSNLPNQLDINGTSTNVGSLADGSGTVEIVI